MFNTVRTGNYSQSAKAVVGASDKIFDAAMSAKPDFTKIAKEAIKARSLERREVVKAEAEVASSGLKAFTDVTRIKNDIESEKRINDIKRPAKRMAGVVAGLGAISQAAVMNKNLKDDKAERAELRALDQANFDAKLKLIQSENDASKALIEQMKALNNNSSAVPKTDGSAPTSSGSASTSNQASSSTKPTGGSAGMRYMRTLTDNGMSATQAAALVGHLDVESAGFTAHEEFKPNAYGTRGAGVLQWTNIPGGSQRRTEFENWSSSQGLDPKSFEANSGYLLHEMQTGNHWTGGGSLQGFKGITDLNEASRYLESNYIRPSAGSSGRRQSAAQNYLNEWNNLNRNN